MEYTSPQEESWNSYKKMLDQAKFPYAGHWELVNQYGPREGYEKWIIERPWWLIETPIGLITIGHRKRVYIIDWSKTPIRTVITMDNTTKDMEGVHAWGEEKMVEYLTTLATMIPGGGNTNQQIVFTRMLREYAAKMSKDLEGFAGFIEQYPSIVGSPVNS